jgi:hypothetical protein
LLANSHAFRLRTHYFNRLLAWRGVEFDPKQLEVNQGYVGIELLSKDFPSASLVVKPEDDEIVGWIGYESCASVPGLSVWFYSTAATTEDVQKRLEMARKQAGGRGKVEVDAKQHYVSIFLLGNRSEGDKEWFTLVLDAVASES